jgi:hypothetical protein
MRPVGRFGVQDGVIDGISVAAGNMNYLTPTRSERTGPGSALAHLELDDGMSMLLRRLAFNRPSNRV